MKYKAKESYKKLSDNKNYYAFGDSSKHILLMAGVEINIDAPPKELVEHLESAEPKKKKDSK
ncbi:hypothetical protein [uncultured Mediterranean phage uvMED]|nr:hypothetical protein [uncultured Mediterranean phage uvMED]